MDEKFSGCEIVEIAIQIEKNGKDFYFALAEKADNHQVKELFEFLAEAEDRHIDAFQKIFNASCSYEPEGNYPGEYFAYMNALASQYIFTKKDQGKKMAEKINDYINGIEMGIQFEKDSILYYEGMKKIVSDKDKKVIDKLIAEEKNHLERLCGLKGGC